MKKMIFGGLLFLVGMLGVIALLAVSLAQGPWSYSGWNGHLNVEGWFAALLGMKALGPWILFWLMSVAGLALCALETFRKENR